jgi:hypothetical protein
MARYNLPSGGWVELRDPNTLKARDRKNVIRGVQDPEEGHVMARVVDMSDGIAAMLITAWSVPYLNGGDTPLPSQDLSVLDELSISDDGALQGMPEMLEAANLFKPGTPDPSDYTKPDGSPNLDSPTEPSSV